MDKLVSNQRRKDLRIPFKSVVRLSADKINWHLDKTNDISKSGIFIETGEMFKEGSKVHLNFDLATDCQVKNIKTVGKVVRLVAAKEAAGLKEESGIGIKFSLMPGEEFMIRSFIKDTANQTASVPPSSLPQPAKHICVEAKIQPLSLLKWWLKEAFVKTFTLKGVIVELVLLIVIILVVFTAFL